MVVSKRNLLFQGSIFSCYVSFREGTTYLNLPWFGLSQEVLHHSRCEQKSSALLCLNPFASNLPIVRLAFLCDLVCFVQKPKIRCEISIKNPRNVARECGWSEWPGFCLAIAVSTRVMAMATSMTSTPPIRCDINCAGISLRRAMLVAGPSWGATVWIWLPTRLRDPWL